MSLCPPEVEPSSKPADKSVRRRADAWRSVEALVTEFNGVAADFEECATNIGPTHKLEAARLRKNAQIWRRAAERLAETIKSTLI